MGHVAWNKPDLFTVQFAPWRQHILRVLVFASASCKTCVQCILFFVDQRKAKNKESRRVCQLQWSLESRRYPCYFPCSRRLSAQRTPAYHCRAWCTDIWSRRASAAVSDSSHWRFVGRLHQRRGMRVRSGASARAPSRSEKYSFAGILSRFCGQHCCHGSEFCEQYCSRDIAGWCGFWRYGLDRRCDWTVTV